MGKSVTLFISSVTGNTAMIATGVRHALVALGWEVHDAKPGMPPADDVVVLCFWCRKSTLDPKSLCFLDACKGKQVLLLGTFGGFPSGEYAHVVRDNVRSRVSERNVCLGVFLCQGKVDAKRIEERRNLPADDPHHLDEWGVARLVEGQKHPNETDVAYAQAFVRERLAILDAEGGACSAASGEARRAPHACDWPSGRADAAATGERFGLHAADWGCGQPLIMLHGNGEDGTYFAAQIEHFKTMFRVIALDTRGYGGSPRGSAPFTLEQFARDLADFMDMRGIGAAHLLGFSDGGNVAALFALDNPDRALSLVLNGANLFPEGLREDVRREDAERFRAAQESGDEREMERLRLMMDEPHIDPTHLSRLDMPVLVVAGTDDMILEEHTRLIAQSIPSAQLRFVEGDHFVAAGNSRAFNDAVEEFYRQCGLDIPGRPCNCSS